MGLVCLALSVPHESCLEMQMKTAEISSAIDRRTADFEADERLSRFCRRIAQEPGLKQGSVADIVLALPSKVRLLSILQLED